MLLLFRNVLILSHFSKDLFEPLDVYCDYTLLMGYDHIHNFLTVCF